MVSGVFSIPLGAHGSSPESVVPHQNRAKLPLRQYIADAANSLVRVVADGQLLRSEWMNPVVLMGPSGTGKTTLAHQLFSTFERDQPAANTISTTAVDFCRSYASAVDADALADLRHKFRSVHCLLLDDLHHAATKPAGLTELTSTLQSLIEAQARTIITMRPPSPEQKPLPARLMSLISGGLVIPLAAPGREAREEILRQFALEHEVQLTSESLALLAEHLTGTVPLLRGIVLELAALQSELDGLDMATVKDFIANPSRSEPTLQFIAQRVGKFFKFKVADLRGPSRRQTLVLARGVAMFLSRKLTNKSLVQIGKQFGGRDHTTVLHACRTMESRLITDSELRQSVEELQDILQPT